MENSVDHKEESCDEKPSENSESNNNVKAANGEDMASSIAEISPGRNCNDEVDEGDTNTELDVGHDDDEDDGDDDGADDEDDGDDDGADDEDDGGDDGDGADDEDDDDEDDDDEDDDDDDDESVDGGIGIQQAYSVSDMLEELEGDSSSVKDDLSNVIPPSGQWQDAVHSTSEETYENSFDSPDRCAESHIDELETEVPASTSYYNVPDAEQSARPQVVSDIAGRLHVIPAPHYKNIPDQASNTKLEVESPPALPLDKRGSGISHNYEAIYDDVLDENITGNTSSDGWGSSEFETYDESEDSFSKSPQDKIPALPPRNTSKESVRKTSSSSETSSSSHRKVLDKLAVRLTQRMSLSNEAEKEPDDLSVTETDTDWAKYPPPQLPPPPAYLSLLENKRRLIIENIVDSENSYIASLRVIVKEYEVALKQARPAIISQKTIQQIFFKVKDILMCHHIFSIELSEAIRQWDQHQAIGNAFTASFSKSIVFEDYSAFLNNFSVAMETVKKQARSKPAFADFLKEKMACTPNKLSLFGLMVKPVQRFPQFIMLLQDLLKNTQKDHSDRLPLQIALSELESLTHKLNDTKRESDSHYDANFLICHLQGHHPLKQDSKRCLLRQDDFTHVAVVNGEQKIKTRRLFLLSDLLLCATVIQRDGEAGLKFRYKWSVPIRNVDVVQSNVDSMYRVRVSQGKASIISLRTGGAVNHSNNPHQKEVDDLMHDLPLLESLASLTTQLRLTYEGVSASHIMGLMKSVQLMIQQKSDIDSAVIRLSLPAKGSNRSVYVFQVPSESIKQDWLLDLHNAKLATDPNNLPGWCMPENQQVLSSKLPLFIKPLLLDITKQETKVQSAISVLLPSPDVIGHATQHLWVCSGQQGKGQEGKGQVTIVSLHTNQPHVVESFFIGDSVILQSVAVPGPPFSIPHEHAFSTDTVWMATESKHILICDLLQEERGEVRVELKTQSTVMCMSYLDNRCFVGLSDGALLVYHRHTDGVWALLEPVRVQLGQNTTCPVACLLPVDKTMWVGCGDSVTSISHLALHSPPNTHQQIHKMSHKVLLSGSEGQVRCLAKAGVGLIVSFTHKSLVRLYHLETFQHLQDISIASAVNSMLQGKEIPQQLTDSLSITCMLSSKGLLWLGTSSGHVLTMPLPRLEGVPQIKGRPIVAYHAHTGPVKFLSSVHCGGATGKRSVSKVTDSCATSLCSFDTTAPEVSSLNSRDTDILHQSDNHDPLNVSDQFERFNGFELSDLTRCISSPDLRMRRYEADSVEQMYDCLLQDWDEEVEQQLLSSKKRPRPKSLQLQSMANRVSRMSGAVMNKISGSPGTPSSHRFSTLPPLREDTPVQPSPPSRHDSPVVNHAMLRSKSRDSTHPQDNDEEISAGSSVPTSLESAASASAEVSDVKHELHKTVIPSYPTMVMSHHAHTHRATVVVSGGEGHVNWSTATSDDTGYDDICLLLWQCHL